jgi:hypothetical protein
MPRNRRERDKSASTPSQEDEADILAEVGAAPAEDGSGMLLADEAKVVEAGAVDTESIRENRRIDAIVNKQRGNVEGVLLNVENICDKYDIVLRTLPANALTINVTRRSGGAPVNWRIDSRPKNGSELYAAIRALHGPNEEATYDVSFMDAGKFRGQGRITMPDARPPAPPPGQPMQPPYYGPPGYPPQQQPQQPPPVVQVMPSSTDPMAMMGQMFKLFQEMQRSVQQPQALPQPAAMQQPAPAPPSTDPMAMMTQMFQMFQQMQQQVQPPTAAMPQQPTAAMAQPPIGSPAVPVATDPVSMMQKMFRMFQEMQQGAAPTVAARAAPQPQMQPVAPVATDPMAMMGQMFKLFHEMQQSTIQAMGGVAPGVTGRPPYRGPYTGPRPGYGGQDPTTGVPYAGYPGGPPHQPPQPPKSAAQEFRDSVSFVRTIVDAAQEIQSILPGQAGAQPEAREPEEDTTPVKVMDVGEYKLVLDKKDGHARLWETGWANMGPVLKWVGEQREAIQKANAEKQAKQQQQLPPGYVEVTPGYQPPPGYVAIQVDPSQIQQMQPPQQVQPALPPPPAQMPPPISEPPQRRWGAPTLPGEGN